MKWTKIAAITSGLIVGGWSVPTSWGQTKTPVSVTVGTALVEGTVRDAETKKFITNAVITVKSQSGTMRAQQVVTTNGSYQFILDPKQPYLITTKADGYEPLEEALTFSSSKVDRLVRRPSYLYRMGTKPASTSATVPAAVAASNGTVSTGTMSTTAVSTAATSTTSVTPSGPTVTGATAATGSAGRPPAAAASTGAASTGAASTAGADQPVTGARLTPPKTLDAKVVHTPPLVVAPTGKTTQLRAIQFVQSKAELLPDAQPALEQLLAFLNSNPTAEIELRGHTDNQGDFDENVRLSKQRVEVVKDYLVKNGIAAGRITTRGLGPTRPVANNNNEATRQLNRRVEMIVLKP